MEITPINILILLSGIILGFVIAYVKSIFTTRAHNTELKKMEDYINTHLKITTEGNKAQEEELKTLKKHNENLRISVKTLGQKAGNAEVRLLNIYDKAIRKILVSAPGFASAWENALAESEKEYEDNESGFKSIFNKVIGRTSVQNSPEIQEQLISLDKN